MPRGLRMDQRTSNPTVFPGQDGPSLQADYIATTNERSCTASSTVDLRSARVRSHRRPTTSLVSAATVTSRIRYSICFIAPIDITFVLRPHRNVDLSSGKRLQ